MQNNNKGKNIKADTWSSLKLKTWDSSYGFFHIFLAYQSALPVQKEH